MENLRDKYAHIKGWGIDADPKNDPTYPIKKRLGLEHQGYSWPRPAQQPIDIEVLHSVERPNVSAVFGTSMPPKGLSGMIRRWAFKSTENEYSHWLPLILADRVNEVEGIIEDFLDGRIPNIFAERGYKADLEHNPKALVKKAAIGALLATAAILYFNRKKD